MIFSFAVGRQASVQPNCGGNPITGSAFQNAVDAASFEPLLPCVCAPVTDWRERRIVISYQSLN